MVGHAIPHNAEQEDSQDLKRNSILKTVFSVTGVIVLAKFLGFFKQMLTASAFGATIETDLITLSQSFVGNTQYLLVQVLLSSFTSVYIHTRETDGENAAGRFYADTLKVFSLLVFAVCTLILFASGPLSHLLAPSYDAVQSGRLALYLRLFAPVLLLYTWIAILRAGLNAHDRFVPGELTSAFQSAIFILCIALLTPHLGIWVLSVGFWTAAVWNALFLFLLSRRQIVRSKGNPFRSAQVRSLLRMALPLLLGQGAIYANQMVDKILISGLEEGAVTAIHYSGVLSTLITTFITAFCAILFTRVVEHTAGGRHENAAKLTQTAAVLLTALFLPITLLSAYCAQDVVSIVYGRGAYGGEGIDMSAAGLRGYAVMFVPLAVRELYSRLCYAYQDSRRPMVNATVGIVCNIALSIALCPHYGIFGVALASSFSEVISGILDIFSARRHNASVHLTPLLRLLPLLGVGSAACLLTARWVSRHLTSQGSLVRFVGVSASSLCIYALVISPLLWKLWKQLLAQKHPNSAA